MSIRDPSVAAAFLDERLSVGFSHRSAEANKKLLKKLLKPTMLVGKWCRFKMLLDGSGLWTIHSYPVRTQHFAKSNDIRMDVAQVSIWKTTSNKI